MDKTIMIDPIPHCDHETCDMGQILFECPNCNDNNITPHGWYEYQDRESFELECDNCRAKIKFTYQSPDWVANYEKA